MWRAHSQAWIVRNVTFPHFQREMTRWRNPFGSERYALIGRGLGETIYGLDCSKAEQDWFTTAHPVQTAEFAQNIFNVFFAQHQQVLMAPMVDYVRLKRMSYWFIDRVWIAPHTGKDKIDPTAWPLTGAVGDARWVARRLNRMPDGPDMHSIGLHPDDHEKRVSAVNALIRIWNDVIASEVSKGKQAKPAYCLADFGLTKGVPKPVCKRPRA